MTAPRLVPACVAILAGLVPPSCAPTVPSGPSEEAVVVPAEGRVAVWVDAPRRLAGPVLKTFEEQSGIDVEPTYRETLGEGFRERLLQEAKLGHVDLVWGSSPLSMADLVAADLSIPFRPAGARAVPTQYRDTRFRWIGFAVNPRVIIYNHHEVRREDAPQSIDDMTRAPWAGRAALARPVHGGAAFHAAALFALWGRERAREFFNQIASNGTRLVATESEVRRLVADGDALWGFVDLDLAIGAKREADPVHIFFPDRMAQGAIATPHIAALVRGAPNPAQAKGLFGYLFSKEAAWQLGQNDCALLTLVPDVPKPEWVPILGQFNVTQLDNEAVLRAFAEEAPFLASLGAPTTPDAQAAVRQSPDGAPIR